MNGAEKRGAAGTHLHLGFTTWTNASRGFRSGSTAIASGLATDVIYVGCLSAASLPMALPALAAATVGTTTL
jgi:hypothetical protein